jgi:hypothetical protein
MFLKLLLVSFILVAFVMLALGVKLLFDKKAEFEMHTCAFEDDQSIDEQVDCSSCQIKEIADCAEEK